MPELPGFRRLKSTPTLNSISFIFQCRADGCTKTSHAMQLGLAGFVEIEMEPLESQKRGFTHGHRKVYGVYLMQIPVLTRTFCLAKKSITKQSNAKHSKAKQCIAQQSQAKPSKAKPSVPLWRQAPKIRFGSYLEAQKAPGSPRSLK